MKKTITYGAITLIIILEVIYWIGGSEARLIPGMGPLEARVLAIILVILLFVTFREKTISFLGQASKSEKIKCPMCAEPIMRDAKVCKHCKCDISSNS